METKEIDQSLSCPICSSRDLALLAFMRQYHPVHDWFRCDNCGHIFCCRKQNVWGSRLATVHGNHQRRDADRSFNRPVRLKTA